MRKCFYTPRTYKDGRYVDGTPKRGWFHEWGTETQDNAPGSSTVAIVEDCETGEVIAPYPHQVKFVNEWDEKAKAIAEDDGVDYEHS